MRMRARSWLPHPDGTEAGVGMIVQPDPDDLLTAGDLRNPLPGDLGPGVGREDLGERSPDPLSNASDADMRARLRDWADQIDAWGDA